MEAVLAVIVSKIWEYMGSDFSAKTKTQQEARQFFFDPYHGSSKDPYIAEWEMEMAEAREGWHVREEEERANPSAPRVEEDWEHD